MKYTPSRPVLRGQTGSVNIDQANIAQSLFTQPTLVRSASIAAAIGNTGTFRVGYGGAPTLTTLSLPPVAGEWYDLSQVQVQSTIAGDDAAYNLIYAP